jgi:hypothetical protein
MMKTLAEERDADEIRSRIGAMTGDEPALFGTMSAGTAVCHLREAYRAVLEQRELTAGMKMPFPPEEIKRRALYGTNEWRTGVKAALEIEPGQPGTIPGEFEHDRAELVVAMEQFREGVGEGAHPYFGPMTREDWLRWGYLHADHHLRQFGR